VNSIEYTDDTTFLDYFRLFRKKKYIIIVCVVLAIIEALILSFTAIPVYQATTQLLIERKAPKALSIQEVVTFDSNQNDFFKTQYELLKDRALIRSVIQELKLENSDELLGKPGNPVFTWVKKLPSSLISLITPENPAKNESGMQQDPYSPLIESFLGKLTVHPIINSRLVNVSFEGYSPILVKKITNKLAELYIQKSIFLRGSIEKDTQAWLKEESIKLKSSLEQAERNLENFKGEKKIADFETRRLIAQKKIDVLSEQVVAIAGERVKLKTYIDNIKKFENDPTELLQSLPKNINSQELIKLSSQYSELLADTQELAIKYNLKHPTYKATRQKLKNFEERIFKAVKGMLTSLSIQYEAILAQENSLNSAVLTQKHFLNKLDSSSVQLKSLERDVAIDGNLFKVLDSRFKELNVSSGYNESNIRVVYRAEIPSFPIRPNKKQNVVISIFIGLALGFALVLFLATIDRKIKTIDDVQSAFPYPLLGAIPVFDSKKGQTPVINHPRTISAEGFRILAEKLISLEHSTSQKVFMITSSTVGEGKSTVALNLTAAMAQMGKTAIVIDADLRKPKIHELLHVKLTPGLTELLNGGSEAREVVKKVTKSRFYAIPAGAPNQNPAEILNNKLFKKLIARLKTKFDFVIVDSPPVWNMADAAIISRQCDGVIFVIKAGAHEKKMIQKNIDQISNVLFASQNGNHTPIINPNKNANKTQPTSNGNDSRLNPIITGILFNYLDVKNEDYTYPHYEEFIENYMADPTTHKPTNPLIKRLNSHRDSLKNCWENLTTRHNEP
jgi:succinoglycan biosynthesis transport protein ExoP